MRYPGTADLVAALQWVQNIAQSGGGEVTEQDPAALIKTEQQLAPATLTNLKLTGNDIDKRKKVPYLDLLNAGQEALEGVMKLRV